MERKNTNDISTHRKLKKQRKGLIQLIVICAILLIVLIVVLNWEKFKEKAESISRPPLTEAGFPIALPTGSGYKLMPFDKGFMLLTETYVYVHNKNGSQRYNRQHAYSEPQASVSDEGILIYYRNGKKFSFFGKYDIAYEKECEDNILYGVAGNEDSVGVLFRSDIYKCVLEVYNDKGEQRYIRRFIDENVMQMIFSSLDKDIVLTALEFIDGEMVTTLQKFDTSTEKDAVWKTVLANTAIPIELRIVGNNVFVLCDNGLYIVNLSNGELIGSYSFKGTIVDYDFANMPGASVSCALLIDDYTTDSVKLVLLDGNAKETAKTDVDAETSRIAFNGDTGSVYLLILNQLTLYDGKTFKNTMLKEEYFDFIQVEEEILLLGYDTINTLEHSKKG